MLLICPGIHPPELTESFLDGVLENWKNQQQLGELLIFPTQDYSAYSSLDILNFIDKNNPKSAIMIIAFSAGVVGAIGAALAWQQLRGEIQGLIAIDGWGVPLIGNFPIYRISHDYFTHWSSALLGGGIESFYADPAVEHLELWRSPQTTKGWWIHQTSTGLKTATPTTARTFIQNVFNSLN
ncbi:hypothetical protein [Planktothrix agardhii]|jgi:hypothetical protein|uniref:Alpha/beta hydrolase n=1 Tax=Planktothrix agardhii TaxID=1160 RepID=A0A1J1JGM2_PLAAG|nr:hypothetical protein [Planktothrix agardhii]MCF3606203.1 hypothetical protein [Planktothrix agardhii 1033]BBD56078.1 hypothetical protein NIES204_33990 [Planktothrix agardhii NIES-204]MBG0747944.1 hypothetical protein [Planktothrix agardhii KL2]MCB8750313.1 hypothetical protein [Planktothrix agardhii 1810]MCB8759080.1 hypothetical protein [Planktothrix agardhii 1813]